MDRVSVWAEGGEGGVWSMDRGSSFSTHPDNTMIKLLMLHCSISWSSCNKDNVNKMFRLRKCCSRIILDAEPRHSRSL